MAPPRRRVLTAQGVPFIHAGEELLRSKSMDRDSYNSGDWFNRLDLSYGENGWARGLPPAWDNEANWPVAGPLLADPELRPAPRHIRAALAHFEELLRIRASSSLFRLRTAADVAATLDRDKIRQQCAERAVDIHLTSDNLYDVTSNCDAIVSCSGTVTQVAAVKSRPETWWQGGTH